MHELKSIVAAAAFILFVIDTWQRKSVQSAGLACMAAVLFLL